MFGGVASKGTPTPSALQPYQALDRRGKQRRRLSRPPLRFVLLWIAFAFVLSMLYILRHDILDQPVTSALMGSTSRANVTLPASSLAYDADAHAASHGNLALPLHIYAPLLPNTAPITDITIETCLPLSNVPCKPPTTPELDAELGVWVHVPRPLNAEVAATLGSERKGMGRFARRFRNLESKYIFYRRSRRAGVRRVVDVQIVREGEELVPHGDWHFVVNPLTSSVSTFFSRKKKPSFYLRFRTVSSLSNAHSAPFAPAAEREDEMAGIGRAEPTSEKDAITELDIVVSSDSSAALFTELKLFLCL